MKGFDFVVVCHLEWDIFIKVCSSKKKSSPELDMASAVTLCMFFGLPVRAKALLDPFVLPKGPNLQM